MVIFRNLLFLTEPVQMAKGFEMQMNMQLTSRNNQVNTLNETVCTVTVC